MKKKLIGIMCLLGLTPSIVSAASYSLSAPSSVEVGSTVTAKLTLKETAAWDVKIASAGSTSGCTQSFVDVTSNGKNTTKTLSVTCKATGVGTIAFVATGKITNEKYEVVNISTTKRVTVTPVREKSTDAYLSSITLEGYSLTPSFSKETLEYSATVPSTVNSINLSAKVNESHASVTGTGTFEVSEGINTFKLVTTAESGASKTYVVSVNVEDTNPIEVKIGEKYYTVVKNAKGLPELNAYEEKTIEIKDFSIPGFYSEATKFSLVGLKDESGKVVLAIYNKEEDKYTLYNEAKSNFLTLYLTDFPSILDGYIKSTLEIDGIKVPIYKLKDNSRFVICYGMNIETGEYDYYTFDKEEKTFQIRDEEEIKELKKELKTYTYIVYGLGGCLFLFLVIIICLLSSRKKKNKRKNKKVENPLIKEIKYEDFQHEKELSNFDNFDIDE